MSDDGKVDLTTLLGRLRFYSRYRGEIPRGVCAEAADEIEKLRERCEAYKGQVKAGSDEIDRLRALSSPDCECIDRHCRFCHIPMADADCCDSELESKGCPHMAPVSSPQRGTAEELADSCCPGGCRFTPCRATVSLQERGEK